MSKSAGGDRQMVDVLSVAPAERSLTRRLAAARHWSTHASPSRCRRRIAERLVRDARIVPLKMALPISGGPLIWKR